MALSGKGPTAVAVMWLETTIALIFVTLRLYTRKYLTRSTGWDDYLLIITWFLLMLFAVACTVAALQGFGQHSADLTTTAFVHASRSEIIGQTFCIVGIATSKASVSVFLLRIAVIKWHKWILYLTIVAVSGISFICGLFDFIRCDPVAHVWNPSIPANCWVSTQQYTSVSLTLGSTSAAADFVLAVMPWFILWNLNMKRKEKILIKSSMSLGILAMICGVVRTISLDGLTARSDYSWETVSLILWSSTELMVTILTATIPTFRPLYKSLRGTLHGTSGNTGRGYRLENVEDALSRAQKSRPNTDTLETTDEHNDDYSERAILESGNWK